MTKRKEIVEELIRENLKGFLIHEVQIRYAKEKLKEVTDNDSTMHIMRKISESESMQDQHIRHSEILKQMLKET